ncbi:transposase [Algiphilus sp. W345]|uniref:Transposase n=1 Tax=Banduia mediterranea TaxID=3075609 RepID=A0ABU2WDV3_9GAMM|nr:transposase [Algiphilus sp. W345]MDT0496046.1 transposase [Algiphilus sp. W345]
MARPLRIEFPGAIHHVMARGNARQAIFLSDEDRAAFLDGLGRVCGRQQWRVWAWCLMDNHYHLLIETLSPSLSRGMREVNGVYTQAFNRRHGRVGHVLQGRYKAVLVDRDAYLLEVSRYVVLNPVRAGLVADVEGYLWSSYRAMIGKESPPDWLAVEATLESFGKTPGRTRNAYARFVKDGVNDGFDLDATVRNQIFLGDELFVERMAAQAGSNTREVPKAQRRVKSLKAYEREHKHRDAAIRAAYDSGTYTLPQIGTHFGLHYSTVSRIARGVDRRISSRSKT